MAVTRGTVARISYGLLGVEPGLHIQNDGAVNPGNSGGPDLVKDQMIGVVIGSSVQGQNIGYVIPNEEINGFLQRAVENPEQLEKWIQRLEEVNSWTKLLETASTGGTARRRPRR